MASVERFIARRYLVSKRNIRFINVIGIISIAGITVGVAALLIALSVFNGFNSVVTSVLVSFDPHVRIERRGNISSDEELRLEQELKKDSRIRAFSPFVAGKAMMVAKSFNRVVFVRGIDEERIGNVTGLKEKVVLGSLTVHDTDGVVGIVIGLALADRLGSVIGDEVMIVSPSGFQSALSGMGTPMTMKFRITGIYESNNREYDANYAFTSIVAAQRLFDLSEKYNGLEIRLTDIKQSESVKTHLMSSLSGDYEVSTWYDLHRSLYSVMKIERWSAYILLSLIILVATFNMLGSLTMGVIEKRRDIGVLRSMGMTQKSIVRIFLAEGLLIGTIGTLAGIVIGLAVLYVQIHYQIFPLDTTIYIIPAIPVTIEWTDFVSISFASMMLSFLASFYPARRAAQSIPAEAIRWE